MVFSMKYLSLVLLIEKSKINSLKHKLSCRVWCMMEPRELLHSRHAINAGALNGPENSGRVFVHDRLGCSAIGGCV